MKLPRCAVSVRPHSGHGRRKATSCLHVWAGRSGTLFPPSRSYFPHIPMRQHPTDSDLQPFVSTTARYGFAALPLGCFPRLSSLFPLSGSAAFLIATSEKKVWSVWGASIGFTSRKTTAEKPTVPHTTVKDMDNPQTPKSGKQKNKGGRPRSDEREKRKYSVKVYFNQGSYTKLLRRSKNRQCSLSSLVYELAVNGYVREAMSKEEAANLRSLSGMANNLNQLAHEAHVHHFSLVEKRVLELARKIDDVLIRLGNS